jgi:hypothetical protein
VKIVHQKKYQSTYSADKSGRGRLVQITGAQGSRMMPRAQVSFICFDFKPVCPCLKA